MSIHAPGPLPTKPGSLLFGFLFLTALALGFLGTGLVLGTEPRLVFERSEDGSFRVTGSNHFAGHQFFTKTVEGVTTVVMDDAVRDGRHDSARENRKRRRQLHLDLAGANGARLAWDREGDRRLIEDFMRGKEPGLALADPPPLWRMGLAWFCAGFGALTFLGAIQNTFFPKKTPPFGGT
jgi:hypothetical protein